MRAVNYFYNFLDVWLDILIIIVRTYLLIIFIYSCKIGFSDFGLENCIACSINCTSCSGSYDKCDTCAG